MKNFNTQSISINLSFWCFPTDFNPLLAWDYILSWFLADSFLSFHLVPYSNKLFCLYGLFLMQSALFLPFT